MRYNQHMRPETIITFEYPCKRAKPEERGMVMTPPEAIVATPTVKSALTAIFTHSQFCSIPSRLFQRKISVANVKSSGRHHFRSEI